MRTSKVLLLATLLTVAGAIQADAQSITSPYAFIEKKKDIGPFIGYLFTDRGRVGLGPHSGPLAGVQFAIRLSDPINLGAYVAYFPSERDVIDPSTERGGEVIGKTSMNMLLIAGQLRLHFTGSRTWHGLVPYFYGGAGAAFDVSSPPSCFDVPTQPNCRLLPRERFDFGVSFMGQVGFGMIWLPFRVIGFRLTIDDTIWRLTTPDGYYDEGSTINPIPPKRDWTNNIQVALGAYYWF